MACKILKKSSLMIFSRLVNGVRGGGGFWDKWDGFKGVLEKRKDGQCWLPWRTVVNSSLPGELGLE